MKKTDLSPHQTSRVRYSGWFSASEAYDTRGAAKAINFYYKFNWPTTNHIKKPFRCTTNMVPRPGTSPGIRFSRIWHQRTSGIKQRQKDQRHRAGHLHLQA